MENNRIDQLFREKLAQHTQEVASSAWEQVHQALESDKKSFYFARWHWAAAVGLLISAGWWILRPTGVPPGESIVVNHPAIPASNPWTPDLNPVPLEVAARKTTGKSQVKTMVVQSTEKDVVNPTDPVLAKSWSLPKSCGHLLEVNNPSVALPVLEASKRKGSVQIIYIANEVSPEETGIIKWFHKAQELDPAGLMASIRDKKNELLRFNARNN